MILVVDDEESLCTLIKEILEGRNYQVMTCFSVPEALGNLQKNKFDLVICDLNLKSGKGQSVEKYMRLKNSPHEEVPILFISGNDELLKTLPPSAEKISKPFSVATLLEAVERLLNPPEANAVNSEEAPKKEKPLHPDLAKILKGGKG